MMSANGGNPVTAPTRADPDELPAKLARFWSNRRHATNKRRYTT
jgi:hypothetical protein